LALFGKSNGFTLIEILVALVILSISLLALAGLMATTTRNNAGGGHLTEAATFAQDTLERLRVSPLSSIPVNVDTADSAVGSTGITYTRSWRAVPNASSTLDTINITVKWDNNRHSISMTTTVSQ
jgi:type IV pilus assembly protein PilV